MICTKYEFIYFRNIAVGAAALGIAACCAFSSGCAQSVNVAGADERYRSDAVEIILTGDDINDISPLAACDRLERLSLNGLGLNDVSALAQCSALKYLDLRGNDISYGDFLKLSESLPECEILWDVQAGGRRYAYDTENVILDRSCEGEYEALKYLPNLRSVDATDVEPSEELLRLRESLPDCDITWNVIVNGADVDCHTQTLDLNGVEITDFAALRDSLRWLPELYHVELCDSGLTNEQMEELCTLYQQIKFVWRIFCGPWDMRTDVVDFSTANVKGVVDLTDSDIVPLKYCTDLECLDLGHNNISDLTPLAGLTKLRVLIVVCAHVDDISMLGGLENLEFVELYCNEYSDISVISNWKKLRWVNICNNAITDFSPLLECPELEMIWISKNIGASEWRPKLSEAFPQAKVSPSMAANVTITAYGWRPIDYRALGFTYWHRLNSLHSDE